MPTKHIWCHKYQTKENGILVKLIGAEQKHFKKITVATTEKEFAQKSVAKYEQNKQAEQKRGNKRDADGRGARPLPSPWRSGGAEQLSSATGREVGRSLEKEFGSLKPWSVGEGVEHWECGACSDGGEGEAEGAPPPMW